MGATNLTPNYSLSQFISTDKPAWLQDYNGDMLKIDSGINAAKLAADSAANAASAAQNDATTALNGVSSLNTTVGTLSTTLGTAVGNINTINSLIGNGTPTTTDQTIIGAINEIDAKVNTLDGAVDNSYVRKSGGVITVTADGTKTYSQLLDELIAGFNSAISANYSYDIDALNIAGIGALTPDEAHTDFNTNNPAVRVRCASSRVSASDCQITEIELKTSGSYAHRAIITFADNSATLTDFDSTAPSNGQNLRLYYTSYKYIDVV